MRSACRAFLVWGVVGLGISIALACFASLAMRPRLPARYVFNCDNPERRAWPVSDEVLKGLRAWWVTSHPLWETGPKSITTSASWPLVVRLHEIDSLEAGMVEQLSGWPLACFRSTGVMSPKAKRTENVEAIPLMVRGAPLSEEFEYRGETISRTIPLMPIGIGLAVDAAFWGGLAWCALGASRRLRSIARRRRGLCPRCGYDLRVDPSAGCPECGWNR